MGLPAEAEDAVLQALQLGPILPALETFTLRCGRHRLEPGPDQGVLGVGMSEIGHQVLDDRQVQQRIDLYIAPDGVDRLGAGERVGPVDIHGAGAADALAAGAAERQRRVDLVQCAGSHRPRGSSGKIEAPRSGDRTGLSRCQDRVRKVKPRSVWCPRSWTR